MKVNRLFSWTVGDPYMLYIDRQQYIGITIKYSFFDGIIRRAFNNYNVRSLSGTQFASVMRAYLSKGLVLCSER